MAEPVYLFITDDRWGFNLISIFILDVVPVKSAGFGRADSRPILLDNVRCTAGDGNISQCVFDTSHSAINCDHSEDAGVICGGM